MIIGSRYGSQDESGKSITNLEYLEAKAKGLPVFVFVLKQILNSLPIWKQNKEANYSSMVDTPKLFEFVEQLHESKDHWIFPFEEVQHIEQTLRNQFAYLFMDGLFLRERVKNLKLSPALTNLSGKSLKLLFERPIAWEYQFFSSVLVDEMNLDQEFKWDLQYGLQISVIQRLDDKLSISNWILQKIADVQGLVKSAEILMNNAIQEALRGPGVPGDPEHLVYVARRVAQVRKALLKWTIEFNCTEISSDYKRLLFLISAFSKDAIEKLESFPTLIDAEIAKGIEANKRGEKYVANIMLKFGGNPYQEELMAEFGRFNTNR